MKYAYIVEKMTLEQKAKFCSGKDYWHLEGLHKFDLPEIMVTDGPHGLRKQNPNGGSVGLGNSYPATCFPPAATTACSWDTDLIKEMGEALGDECRAEKVSVLLGPGVNIKRSPLCGRNFEYFSEDPVLAGEMGAAFVNGVQSKGIGTSLKHFAVNSQEARRMVISEVVDERTLREIYFPAFETTVKKAQPWTIMNSYNRINGVYSSENEWLQQQVLRGEWGYKGLIVTDWGSSVDRIKGLKAGTDVEMPSSGGLWDKKIVDSVKNGDLEESVLNERVDNVVNLIMRSKKVLQNDYTFDKDKHHSLARKVAENSVVLLKNEDNILPVSKTAKIAIIGEMAKAPRYQGAGSSLINPTKLSNALHEFRIKRLKVSYARGYDKNNDIPRYDMLQEASNAAKNADVTLVFVGLTESYEAEGYDRTHLSLPKTHNRLINEVCKVSDNVVVVLSGGACFEMPWINKVKGVIHGYLGGQAGGEAITNVILGDVCPSGKLAETYPLHFKDNPTYNYFPGGKVTSEHREGIYIGYRYYDTAKKEVLFPFGYGLSYTTFKYSNLKVSANKIKDTDTVDVSFKIKNTGKVDGAEIAQIYVADKESTIFRPKKELKAFKKVFLKAGEEQTVTVSLDKRAFAYYNVNINDWHVETGEFDILVGASVADIKLNKTITVESTVEAVIPDYHKTAHSYYTADIQNVPDDEFADVYGKKLPASVRDKREKLTTYNCLDDADTTKWGNKINTLVKEVMKIALSIGADGGLSDAAMMEAMATQIPIRNFIAMSQGVFSADMADGLLLILNDENPALGFAKIVAGIPSALPKIKPLIKSI